MLILKPLAFVSLSYVQVGPNRDIFLAHFWVHFPSFQKSDRLLNTECDQENLNIAQKYYMHKMQRKEELDPCKQYKTNHYNWQTCTGQKLKFMKSFICCHENSIGSKQLYVFCKVIFIWPPELSWNSAFLLLFLLMVLTAGALLESLTIP